ncbi:MAG: hypothetical protein Q4D90_03740 [bacterium]|nr:hypothetical protein [bacterium]
MRGLQVYFCPKCGYYRYYQLVKNAVCPKCDIKMRPLLIDYTKFMDMDCDMRDAFIGKEMLRYARPLTETITEPHKQYNNREEIGKLMAQIQQLETENQKLTQTVAWMHETIWQMLKEKKGLTTSSQEAAAAAVPSEVSGPVQR